MSRASSNDSRRRPTSATQVRPAAPDPEAVEQAVGLLSMAHRPVILAGRGATTNAARDALLQLAERLGAPVATTLLGKDLFRGDAFDLGICGNLGHPEGLEAITRSDCIVAFGAGLTWANAVVRM